jgi:hypothetical protein
MVRNVLIFISNNNSFYLVTLAISAFSIMQPLLQGCLPSFEVLNPGKFLVRTLIAYNFFVNGSHQGYWFNVCPVSTAGFISASDK